MSPVPEPEAWKSLPPPLLPACLAARLFGHCPAPAAASVPCHVLTAAGLLRPLPPSALGSRPPGPRHPDTACRWPVCFCACAWAGRSAVLWLP